MCVYVYVCVYTCVCVHVCVCVYMYVLYVDTYMYGVCMCICSVYVKGVSGLCVCVCPK